MEIINYPLVYFELKPNAFLGILVGTNYQMVAKDLKSVKNTISDHLTREYKKFNEYPYIQLKGAKLKTIEVKIRPTYKEEDGAYPLPNSIKVPIVAVYGENNSGFYECHLPLLKESFYYYDVKQFQTLVTHFSSNLLNNYSPADIHKLLLHKKPQLDEISLKVNFERDYSWGNWANKPHYPTLSKLAEKYPYSKALRRNNSAFPEAAWEMDHLVDDLMEKIISVRCNILVVGKSGVGKSSIIKQAIKKITTHSKKQKLDHTFWQITPQRITSSAKYLGEWQETCEELIQDLQSANGVLWVVDFIRLLQIGGEGPEDSVAAFLVSFLQQGKLQLMGEVTETQVESIRRLLPGFIEHFQILTVDELKEETVYKILDKFADFSKKNLKLSLNKSALELSYRLLLRYYPYESFPGKAVKFLGQCVNEAQLNQVDSIDNAAVISNFIKQTGMPELFLRDDVLLDSQELKSFFNKKIIGQPRAIDHMADVVKIFKAGLNNPHKPIATMIFAGPTGVGKTASAKALADYFFGIGQKQSPLIRIDMSEFQHPSQINRFIGAGKETGKLVQDIRERPFSVLLLDEVEKADPSIFDALLTVLDEGILVDAFGRITNFRNTIIIMTSNLGASNRKSISFVEPEADAKYNSAIHNFFRPEFVNRIDSVVLFNSLDKESIDKITLKELEDLKQREGFTKRGLTLRFGTGLIAFLAEAGFDERYGARPLQRTVETSLVAPLANWLLDHPKLENTSINIDKEASGKLTISL